MPITAVGSDWLEPPQAPTGCWCCGDPTVVGSLVRLDQHPEVGVCFQCIKWLTRRKREIQRFTRAAPSGWPWWHRVRYRAGFGRSC